MYAYYGPSNNITLVEKESVVPEGRDRIQVQDGFIFEPNKSYSIDWQSQTLVGVEIPVIPEPVDQIKILTSQLEAATQRADFMEDCLAEMAEKIYTTTV